jgi:hypothetical protein
MTNRSDRGSNKPRGAERFERDDVIRDPIRGLHQGQQPCGAARTGRTHGCTRPVLIAARKHLHRRGRPHMAQRPHHCTATLVQGPSNPSRQCMRNCERHTAARRASPLRRSDPDRLQISRKTSRNHVAMVYAEIGGRPSKCAVVWGGSWFGDTVSARLTPGGDMTHLRPHKAPCPLPGIGHTFMPASAIRYGRMRCPIFQDRMTPSAHLLPTISEPNLCNHEHRAISDFRQMPEGALIRR